MTIYNHIFRLPNKDDESRNLTKVGVAYQNRDESWNLSFQSEHLPTLAALDLQIRKAPDTLFLIPEDGSDWTPIGVGYHNRDGSRNVVLNDDAPSNIAGVKLQLRQADDILYVIRETGQRWQKIGVAKRNGDGSRRLVITTDLLSELNGVKLQLRAPRKARAKATTSQTPAESNQPLAQESAAAELAEKPATTSRRVSSTDVRGGGVHVL